MIIGILIDTWVVLKYHRQLGRNQLIIMMAYTVMPLTAATLQIAVYGFPLLSIGFLLFSVLIFTGIQSQQAKRIKEQEIENQEQRIVSGKLTIRKRNVTVKADDKQKTNGETDPTLTYTVTLGNLVNGDSFTGTLSRSGYENLTSSSQFYDINQNTLALSNNYVLNFIKGTFTIVPSAQCELLTVVTPENTAINGLALTKTVKYTVQTAQVNITCSPLSTWKRYSVYTCGGRYGNGCHSVEWRGGCKWSHIRSNYIE